MTENKVAVQTRPWSSDQGPCSTVDASLKRGSALSIALSDATVGVNLDKLGDWTITVVSHQDQTVSSIDSISRRIGVFLATENEGALHAMDVSPLGNRDARIVAEQTLLQPKGAASAYRFTVHQLVKALRVSRGTAIGCRGGDFLPTTSRIAPLSIWIIVSASASRSPTWLMRRSV